MKSKEIISRNLFFGSLKFILILLLFGGCSDKNETCQDLNEVELMDIYELSLGILGHTTQDPIFKMYSNELFKPMLENVYVECSDLGYEIKKKVREKIKKDGYTEIPKCAIPEEIRIKFISDTINVNKNLFVFSEIISLNDSILLVAVCKKDQIEKTAHKAIFILGRIKSGLTILEYYDANKEMFFAPASLVN